MFFLLNFGDCANIARDVRTSGQLTVTDGAAQ